MFLLYIEKRIIHYEQIQTDLIKKAKSLPAFDPAHFNLKCTFLSIFELESQDINKEKQNSSRRS
jgi:hypothetical protein